MVKVLVEATLLGHTHKALVLKVLILGIFLVISLRGRAELDRPAGGVISL